VIVATVATTGLAAAPDAPVDHVVGPTHVGTDTPDGHHVHPAVTLWRRGEPAPVRLVPSGSDAGRLVIEGPIDGRSVRIGALVEDTDGDGTVRLTLDTDAVSGSPRDLVDVAGPDRAGGVTVDRGGATGRERCPWATGVAVIAAAALAARRP
jgi:hypothetical protein